MPTQETIQKKIDEINEILDSGVSSTTVDGITTSIDHDSLRRRRSELKADLDALSGNDSGGFLRQIDFS